VTQEIIEMARDSGMELYGLGKDRARFVHHLEAFAKLVAEKALAEHAMREVQRLGQEIEQDADSFCDSNCVWTDHHPDCKLAQPEQEPVCPDCKAEVLYECVACSSNNYPPPQRPWVGLTLEQYVAINSSCTTVDQAVGSTERQLKENNT
jgi:hypothetical protein